MTGQSKSIIITLASLFLLLRVFAQDPGYRSFRLTKNNKPVKINCLYKNNDGYLLIGSDNGLYKFDGEKYFPVYFENREYTDTVTAIFEDRQKMTWLGFKNGRIGQIINKKLQYFNPEEGTPKKKITGFLQDTENNIWFSTGGEGIYYIKNNHLYLINEDDGLSDLNVNTIALAENGDILAGTDQGINSCSIRNGKKNITTIGTKSGLPDYIITAIIPAGNNRYWIGMQDKGFCLYEHPSKKFIVPESAKNWSYGQINSLNLIQNILWIGTENHGLFSYSITGEKLDSTQRKNTGNMINSLMNDLQGNLWLSTAEYGLVKSPGESLVIIPIPGSPVFEHVHAVLADHQGNIWVNNLNNELIHFSFSNENRFTRLIKLPGVTQKTDITSLYQDKYDHIWVGTMGKGLFIIDPVNLTQRVFDDNDQFINSSILSISGKDNHVFISSLQGSMAIELSDNNKNILERFRYNIFDNASTGTNYIYSIFKDSRNRIWFATDGNGLTMMENNIFSYYHEKNKIKDDHIYSITEDKSGNIWFSTANAGIYKFDGKTFTNFGLKEGLSDLNISVLKTDNSGNIFVVHKKGLDILDPATENIYYVNSTHGIGTINAEDLGAVAQDLNGNILVNTTTGLLKYTYPVNSIQKPKALIESIQLFLKDIDDTRVNRFSHDENNFTFNYTGLYYSDPSMVYYQYKLDGLDSSWVVTKDKSKNFPRLEPGKYTFRLQASLINNFKNADEVSYQFVIEKAFYKRYWFIIGSVVVALLLLYWYIKNRENALRKMERLRQEKIQYQFEVLRTQVNPHFLFNSFNTLISTIEEDPAMAVEYAEQLSDFFRHIVNFRDKEVIDLREEIELLKNYYSLQQKRHGNHLQMEINITDQQQMQYYIPPLTIQLLMENAIKHNVVSKDKPLIFSLEIINEEMLLVKNNINPRLSKQQGAGMGLQNIMNRYNLLSNKKVEIISTKENFIVSLPLLKK